ncbi:MAG: pilin N-terminal domain-containing protein [Peptoniphilus harei]|nr:pilin N-terminal domain-containing protein [Peptoniphilus harei]
MNKKKILSLIMALVMLVGVFSPLSALAATDEVTESLTIHKILMDKDSFAAFTAGTTGKNGTEYDGNKITNVKDFFIDKKNTKGTATEIAGAYFVVKNADGTKFVKEDGTETDKEEEALKGTTTADGLVLKTSKLKGTYKIFEDQSKSSYKNADGKSILADAKAVPIEITLPLVNNSGVVKEAHVYPKNTEDKPEIDKNFKYGKGEAKLAEGHDNTNAIGPDVGASYPNADKKKSTVTSELGKKIPFEVKTKIPAKAKYKKLVWDDQMQKGLVYNKDLAISGLELTKDTDYKIYETNRGFRLVMQDSGLKKIEEAAANTEVELTLTYSAHLDGTVKPDQVKENNVTFDYSNKPGKENEPPDTKPSNKKITVSKTWASDGVTITEADRHVKAVFTLQEKQEDGSWKDVAEYESNYAENFTHEFTGLDDSKTYRVVESVSGYEPEYQKTTENGKVVIVNKIDKDNPKTLKPTTPKVVNGGRRFVKTNQDGSKRLAGAEFYVKDSTGKKYLVAKSSTKADAESIDVSAKKGALDTAVKNYNDAEKAAAVKEEKDYKAVTIDGTEYKTLAELKAAIPGLKTKIDSAQDAYNTAFVEAAQAYEWREATEAPTDALLLVSDTEGRLEITGLQYGDYKLEEKTPPAGYAKLNGTVDFKVEKGSYDSKSATEEIDYKKDKTDGTKVYGKQIKNKQVSIPQTGGIGTVIFTVVGISLMAGAVMAMKKNREEA